MTQQPTGMLAYSSSFINSNIYQMRKQNVGQILHIFHVHNEIRRSIHSVAYYYSYVII